MSGIEDIGVRLVAERRALGLTQGDLADRLGVKRQQVQRWEANAYRTASLQRVARVADALGWTASDVPLAAEGVTAYGALGSVRADVVVTPARDLGEIAARVRRAAADLQARHGLRSIAVFGSFARGEQGPDSDVDALIELEAPTLESQFGAERALERILGRRVETGTPAAVNPRLRESIASEAVRVWPA